MVYIKYDIVARDAQVVEGFFKIKREVIQGLVAAIRRDFPEGLGDSIQEY